MDFEPSHPTETGSQVTPTELALTPVDPAVVPVEPVVVPAEPLDLIKAVDFGRISKRIADNVGRASRVGPSPQQPTLVSAAPASSSRGSPRLQPAFIVIAALIAAVVVGAIVPLLLSMFLR
jgi:hypothetical protein